MNKKKKTDKKAIEKNNSVRGFKQSMFVLPKNSNVEMWDGPRTGTDGVKDLFGADEAYDNTRFMAFLKEKMVKSKHMLYMDSPGKIPTLISDENTKKCITSGKEE